VKLATYFLEVCKPGHPDLELFTLEAATPFQAVTVGDLLNPCCWSRAAEGLSGLVLEMVRQLAFELRAALRDAERVVGTRPARDVEALAARLRAALGGAEKFLSTRRTPTSAESANVLPPESTNAAGPACARRRAGPRRHEADADLAAGRQAVPRPRRSDMSEEAERLLRALKVMFGVKDRVCPSCGRTAPMTRRSRYCLDCLKERKALANPAYQRRHRQRQKLRRRIEAGHVVATGRLTLGVRRHCDRCGVLFSPERSTARYCGARCRVAAHRAKK
jgi:hypothetical protein